MRVIAIAVIAALALGCGSADPKARKPSDLVPVSGKVTLKGEPLEGALVIFMPSASDGFAAQGFTDSAGVYHAETRSGKDIRPGAAPGSYRVMVSKFLKPDGTPADPNEPPANSAAKESLPIEYSDPTTGGKLRAVVGTSGGEFNFDIKAK